MVDRREGDTSPVLNFKGYDLTGNDLPPDLSSLAAGTDGKKSFPRVRPDSEMLTSISSMREIKSDRMNEPKVAYNFNHPRRGFAIIINQENFHPTTGQAQREGSEVDAKLLSDQFLSMGFDVGRYDDLTGLEMRQLVRDLSKGDYSDCDCFILAILSHGAKGRVYAYDNSISIASLLSPFKGDNCQTLIGKPKLFFIQACRGLKFMHGVELSMEGEDEPDRGLDEIDSTFSSTRVIPSEADVFIAYSVVPGYFAWRNNVDGSWFIRALVRVLNECSHTMELLEMMTYVNRIVAYDYESSTDDDFMDGMKQVPSIVSRLTKSVYFPPKTGPDEEYNVTYSHQPSPYFPSSS